MRKIFLALALIFVVGLFVGSTIVHAQTSHTLYAGSVTSGSGTYGFGLSSTDITSPGPTLTLKEGTPCTITVNNVANMPHSFEIVTSKAVSTSPLWSSGIDLTNYIPPGGSGSVTFTPTQTGDFYYVCTVPGHIALGMWGNVKVTSSGATPTTPEFPSALTIAFMAVLVTALAAYTTRQKIKIGKFSTI